MGNEYILICPGKNQVAPLGSSMDMLIDLLAVPVDLDPNARSDDKPSQDDTAGNGRSIEQTQSQSTSGRSFEDLPQELHDLVMDHLEIEEVIDLSLTSQYFWAVGQRHIDKYIKSFLQMWAREPIYCITTAMGIEDFPTGTITTEEEEEWTQIETGKGRPAATFNHHMRKFNPEIVDLTKPFNLLDRVINSETYQTLLRADLAAQLRAGVNPRKFFPTDQSWVLRNLTKKEFVRGEKIGLRSKYIKGRRIKRRCFEELLSHRIAWQGSFDKTRGIWSDCDRFDVTTMARHKETSQGEIWKDISREVVKGIYGKTGH